MVVQVRQATGTDATLWLNLATHCLDSDCPDRRVYDLQWAAAQLAEAAGGETWIAEENS